jgi:hypothetical protein
VASDSVFRDSKRVLVLLFSHDGVIIRRLR